MENTDKAKYKALSNDCYTLLYTVNLAIKTWFKKRKLKKKLNRVKRKQDALLRGVIWGIWTKHEPFVLKTFKETQADTKRLEREINCL